MDRRKYNFQLVLGRPSKQPIKIKSSEGRREKKSLDSLPCSHTLSPPPPLNKELKQKDCFLHLCVRMCRTMSVKSLLFAFLQGLTSNKITGAKKKKTGRKDAKQCEQIKEKKKEACPKSAGSGESETTSVGQAGTTLGKEDHTGTNF